MDCLPDPTSWTPRTLDKGPPALTGDQAGETPPLPKGRQDLERGPPSWGLILRPSFPSFYQDIWRKKQAARNLFV